MERFALIAGILGLVLICLLCPWCRAPAIENDVRQTALACATESGLEPEQVIVSGRDITLTGMVGSDQTRASVTACIQNFDGTRIVVDRLTARASGVLEFSSQYDALSVTGVVPSSTARTRLIDEANGLWGEGRVTHDLEVDSGRSIGGWSDDDFASFLAALHHSRRDLDIELTEGEAIVSGTVLSELAKYRVLGAAVALLPGFEVVDRLTIREPATDRERLQSSLDQLLAGRVVEFATDSAELTAVGRATLDEVVRILKTHGGSIEVSGHTDSTGTPEHNLELSRQRAETAAGYLIANGIKRDRCVTVGFGQTRPIASNATDKGRQENRRTEIHAIKEN